MKIVIENKKGFVIESWYELERDKIDSYSKQDNTYIFINESGYKELHIIKKVTYYQSMKKQKKLVLLLIVVAK